MKKLKVLLIAYNNLGKGGIQNQIMGIVRSLKDRVDFDIVIWDNVKDYYSTELKHYGVRSFPAFGNREKPCYEERQMPLSAMVRSGKSSKKSFGSTAPTMPSIAITPMMLHLACKQHIGPVFRCGFPTLTTPKIPHSAES